DTARAAGARIARRLASHGYVKGLKMSAKTYWDTFKSGGENVVEKIKGVIREGNIRRVVIQHEGRTVAEFPLTAGVVGAVLAPVLAAIGAIVAVMQNCSIEVEREHPESAAKDEKPRTVA